MTRNNVNKIVYIIEFLQQSTTDKIIALCFRKPGMDGGICVFVLVGICVFLRVCVSCGLIQCYSWYDVDKVICLNVSYFTYTWYLYIYIYIYIYILAYTRFYMSIMPISHYMRENAILGTIAVCSNINGDMNSQGQQCQVIATHSAIIMILHYPWDVTHNQQIKQAVLEKPWLRQSNTTTVDSRLCSTYLLRQNMKKI